MIRINEWTQQEYKVLYICIETYTYTYTMHRDIHLIQNNLRGSLTFDTNFAITNLIFHLL